MKLNSPFFAIMVIFLAMAIAGCSDSDSTSTSNSGLPNGNLLGKIGGLMDSVGHWASDRSGVTVEAIGSGISAQSDSSGYWELKNLPSRTYNIRFSKPGYMDYYQTGYTYVGGASSRMDQEYFLVMQPRFTLLFDGMTISLKKGQLNGALFAHCSENAPSLSSIAVWIVFGSSPTIDLNDHSTFIALLGTSATNRDEPSKSMTFEGWSISDTTLFHSGQTVFCRVYPCIYTTTYFDIDKRQTIYQGQGIGSNVLSQILP